MKKILLPICAMLLCMTACQKEDEGVLRLEIERYNTNAKVHIDDAHYAVWDNGDKIWLNGAEKTVTVNNSNNTAKIIGVTPADSYTAIYPSDWVVDQYTINYPATQIYCTNDDCEQVVKAPMAAVSTGRTLKFHNLGSIMAVKVVAPSYDIFVTNIELSISDNDHVCGDYYLWDGSIRGPLATNRSNTVTLDCTYENSDGEFISGEDYKIFYIALPPDLYGFFTITVYDSDGNFYEKTQQTWQIEDGAGTLNQVTFVIPEDEGDEGGGGESGDGILFPEANQIYFKTQVRMSQDEMDEIINNSNYLVNDLYFDNEMGYYIANIDNQQDHLLINDMNSWSWLSDNTNITTIIFHSDTYVYISFANNPNLTNIAFWNWDIEPIQNMFNTTTTNDNGGTLHLHELSDPELWVAAGWGGNIASDLW